MKLVYTDDDIQRWRQKRHGGRLPSRTPRSTSRLVAYIDKVGYCFAFESDGDDLPSLSIADPHSNGFGSTTNGTLHVINGVLLEDRGVYLGRALRRRPILISLEFLPYFYALQGHEGKRDDYQREFSLGRLTPEARAIMRLLMKSSPRNSRELREALSTNIPGDVRRFDRAMVELESKLLATRTASNGNRLSSWATVYERFPAAIKKARRITIEEARREIIRRLFENQLVLSMSDIQKVFGWKRQAIYKAIGNLVHAGVITASVKVKGKNTNYYCLVH